VPHFRCIPDVPALAEKVFHVDPPAEGGSQSVEFAFHSEFNTVNAAVERAARSERIYVRPKKLR